MYQTYLLLVSNGIKFQILTLKRINHKRKIARYVSFHLLATIGWNKAILAISDFKMRSLFLIDKTNGLCRCKFNNEEFCNKYSRYYIKQNLRPVKYRRFWVKRILSWLKTTFSFREYVLSCRLILLSRIFLLFLPHQLCLIQFYQLQVKQ